MKKIAFSVCFGRFGVALGLDRVLIGNPGAHIPACFWSQI